MTPRAAAARAARGAIENLLATLGWPADERALSLAIDRCVQIEEDAPPGASKAAEP